MINTYAIEKLTELLIRQDMKDKQKGKVEMISKVGAYKSLINLIKEMIENERQDKRIVL